jgi:hypothetical protein
LDTASGIPGTYYPSSRRYSFSLQRYNFLQLTSKLSQHFFSFFLSVCLSSPNFLIFTY